MVVMVVVVILMCGSSVVTTGTTGMWRDPVKLIGPKEGLRCG